MLIFPLVHQNQRRVLAMPNESIKRSKLANLAKICIVLFLALCGYAFSYWSSFEKIDAFCNEINAETKVSDLRSIADRVGVDLRGPMLMPDSNGPYVYAIATSGFTVGEYACSIHALTLSGTVQDKKLGY